MTDLGLLLIDLLPGSPDQLRWPGAALLLGGLVGGLTVWWARSRESFADALPVSHAGRIVALPRFRTLVRRRRLLVGLRGACSVVVVAGCLLLVARPGDVQTQVNRASRDLVICLDVSPSMRRTAADVTRVFQDVVQSLPGDRVGLTVFDGQSVVKFPLTDAREFVDSALEQAETAFETKDRSFSRSAAGYPSSQVGDGLYSCVEGFDRLDERRGRVVLVASDNHPFGAPVHTLAEAADLARERGVVVYGLGVPQMERRPLKLAEFQSAAESTGGSLAMLDESGAAADVVATIDRIERRRLVEPSRRVVTDDPRSGTLVVLAGLLGLAACGWRRRS